MTTCGNPMVGVSPEFWGCSEWLDSSLDNTRVVRYLDDQRLIYLLKIFVSENAS
jgi:hypothetical protein